LKPNCKATSLQPYSRCRRHNSNSLHLNHSLLQYVEHWVVHCHSARYISSPKRDGAAVNFIPSCFILFYLMAIKIARLSRYTKAISSLVSPNKFTPTSLIFTSPRLEAPTISTALSFYIHTTGPRNAYLCIDCGVAFGDVEPPRVSPDHLLSRCYCDGNSGSDESTPGHYGNSYQPNIDGPPFVRELRRREYNDTTEST
jgi:hypothetical protein